MSWRRPSRSSPLSRPREVVLKHESWYDCLRDEKTLAELETQLQTLQLEQARQTDPWELISTPTLLENPVAPRKKRIVALGLLGGLVLGCGAALIRDRRSGLVYGEEELKSLLPFALLDRLLADQPEHWTTSAQLLTQHLLSEAQSVALIPVGNIPPKQLQRLQQELERALDNRQLLVTRDLLASTGVAPNSGPAQVRQRQQLHRLRATGTARTPVAGLLIIDFGQEA